MKRLFSLAVVFAVALFFSFAPSAAGTAPSKKEPAVPVLNKPGVQYKQVRVLKGGNLALIAERCGHTQAGWRPLADVNPQLSKVEKVGEMWRVLVQPRQILNLPLGWSYQTLNPEYVEPYPPTPQGARGAEGTTPPMPPVITPISSIGGGGLLWFLDQAVWALILIILAAIAVSAALAVPLIRRRDPSRYPSRVPGGLSGNAETAVRQLGIAYPGRRYIRIERCRLRHEGGPRRILIRKMDFGDGVSRDAYLNDGDQVYRGTLPGGSSYDYFLRSCGNLGPEFLLPDGWRVMVIESHDIGPAVYEPPMAASSATAPAPVPVPATEPAQAPAPDESPVAEPAPKPTAEVETSVVTATTEESAAIETEEIKSPRKVKVTVGDLSIEVVGNGEVPDTKVETDDGYTFIIRQGE